MTKRDRELEGLTGSSAGNLTGGSDYTANGQRRSKRHRPAPAAPAPAGTAATGPAVITGPSVTAGPAAAGPANVAPTANAPAPQQHITAAPQAQATTVATQQPLDTIPEDDENEGDQSDHDDPNDTNEREQISPEPNEAGQEHQDTEVSDAMHNAEAEVEDTASGLQHGSDGEDSHSRRSREPRGDVDASVRAGVHNDLEADLDNDRNDQERGQVQSAAPQGPDQQAAQGTQTPADGIQQRRKAYKKGWDMIFINLNIIGDEAEVVDRFRERRAYSNWLYDHGHIVQLPNWPDEMDTISYFSELNNAIDATDMKYCEAEWLRQISFTKRSEFGYAAVAELERTLSSVREGVSKGTGRIRYPSISGDVLHAEWSGRLDQIRNGYDFWPVPMPKTFQRCEAAYDRICKHTIALHPPPAGEFETAEDYCEHLTKLIDDHLIYSVKDSWARWPARDEAFRARWVRMKKRVIMGNDPYGPEIPSPTEPDYKSLAKELGFGHNRSSQQPDRWLYKGSLGSGTGGQVSVWFCHDKYGTVTDRVAIKESWLFKLKEDQDTWNEPSLWNGAPANRDPMEYATLTMLRSCHTPESIISCRACGIYDEKRMFRLYTEYCPHRDLETVIDLYRDWGSLNLGSVVRIPDRVLWCVFEALASAVCLMYQGFLPGSTTQAPNGFRPMLHRDLKPANIFLAAPRQKGMKWPKIPIPKVGDFGLVSWSDSWWVEIGNVGTYGYSAPEVLRGKDDREGYTIDYPSEVWAIGRIMLSLINLNHANDHYLPVDKEIVDFEEEPPIKDGAEDNTDETLLVLVLECLQGKPPDRPKPDDLWQRIQVEIEDGRYLAAPEDELLLFEGDKYAPFAR